MSTKSLTVQQRKSIFLSLVEAQDEKKMSISESRTTVAQQYDITTDVVKQIEEEGLNKEWPPLDAA